MSLPRHWMRSTSRSSIRRRRKPTAPNRVVLKKCITERRHRGRSLQPLTRLICPVFRLSSELNPIQPLLVLKMANSRLKSRPDWRHLRDSVVQTYRFRRRPPPNSTNWACPACPLLPPEIDLLRLSTSDPATATRRRRAGVPSAWRTGPSVALDVTAISTVRDAGRRCTLGPGPTTTTGATNGRSTLGQIRRKPLKKALSSALEAFATVL